MDFASFCTKCEQQDASKVSPKCVTYVSLSKSVAKFQDDCYRLPLDLLAFYPKWWQDQG